MSNTTTTTTTKKQNWNMFATFDTNANTNTTFCPDCCALIELPECNPITCGRCGFSCTYDDLPKTKVVTKSAERSIPSWLSKVVESEKVNDGSRTRATVDEECPKCGNPIVEFYTMQMRSVDEGQTVFYECPKCGYTWSQNN